MPRPPKIRDLPPPSDNLGPHRRKVRGRKGPARIAKPLHADGDDLNELQLADEIDRWLQGTGIPELTDVPEPEDDRVTEREARRANELLEELASRAAEALSIFEPMPVQDAFFKCRSNERLFLGGNRGGKTLTGAIEVARIMTGRDPYGKQPKADGRAILVGKDLGHCGKVMARKLFRAGQFWMIKDPHTKLWRAFRPWQEWDRENVHLRKPAPPLIPARLVKSISWENKKEGIIKSFTLKNGWEGTFFSSEGDPPQGWDVNLIWFDEEIVGTLWYLESAARLVDRRGIFIWTATPQAGTIELYDLYERALESEDDPDSEVRAFQISMMENPHLDAKSRQVLLDKIKDEGDYEVRVDGKFALTGMKVYPEFQPHGLNHCGPIHVPKDWTRYVTVDPGVQVCGVLFCACPPQGTPGFYPGQVLIYDELYIKRCDATMFGRHMAIACQGTPIYQWAIDLRMGRQSQATGKTYAQHYAQALKDNALECERTGSSFSWASDDVDGGIEAVRQLMRPNKSGYARLLVIPDRCPNLCKEASRYAYLKKPSGEITDQPIKRKFHLMDCLRYLAKLEPKYRKAKPQDRGTVGTAVHILEKKRERAKLKEQAQGGGFVRLG